MTSFLRESKFRHTIVQLDKREKFYESAMLKTASNVEGNSMTANSKYISYIDVSRNAIGTIPVNNPGRHNEISMIRTTNINDIIYHRFYRDKLLACSNDGTVNIYDLTNGISNYSVTGINILNDSDVLVAPLKGLINNPVAENIIAVRGNKEISIVDLNTASQARKTPSGLFGSEISCMSFSENGNLIAASSKDKTLKVIDMRCKLDTYCNVSVQSHTGTRPSQNLWLNTVHIFTSGHSSGVDREIFLWDIKQMSQPVFRERIDSSIGILSPFYDPDTQLLVLAGKGDTMIRLYQFDSSSAKLNGISTTSVGDPFRYSCLMPKQACDINNNEILRVLKLTDTSIQPISFTVPRKDKHVFHSDLYPLTIHEAPPSLDAESWLAGLNGEPKKISISPTFKDSTENIAQILDNVDAKAAHLDNDTSSKRNSLEKFIGFGSTLKFRHMYGTEAPKTQCYFNIKPSTASDSALISCSDKFWAVPYEGTGGGPVYVSSFSDIGKVEPSCPLINGHKAPVVDISFSPFHSNIMASASVDCSVKVWSIPHKITSSQNESDAIVSFSTHMNTVKACCFSPIIDGLLCTTSADMTVRLYDINAGNELSCTDLRSNIVSSQSSINSLSFNYDGTTIMACCKDKCLNIIDLRVSEVVGSVCSPENNTLLGRNLRGIWCNKNQSQSIIFTVFSNHLGQRMIQLYDPRKLTSPIKSSVIDNGTGQLFPFYDENNVVFVAGKGDTIIKFYELSFVEDSNVTCEKANEFQTSREPIAGICLLPKREVDVRNVEIASMLKLTNDAVIPISYKVPRAEHLKQYFQDDLYPSVVKAVTPNHSITDWMQTCCRNTSNVKLEPSLIPLKPEDMINLSEKPMSPNNSVKSNRNSQDFRKELDKTAEENKLKEATFNKLSELALQRAQYHPNPSGGSSGHGFKVDVAPIIDSDSDADWDD